MFKSVFLQYKAQYPDEIIVSSTGLIDADKIILKAEERIGVNFPRSYKDFLYEFCFAELFGDEMCVLWPEYYKDDCMSDIAYPGDIVFTYFADRASEPQYDPKRVRICHTLWDDEEFFFDFNNYHHDTNECDIFMQLVLCEPKLYAKTYYEFLCNRIQDFTKNISRNSGG